MVNKSKPNKLEKKAIKIIKSVERNIKFPSARYNSLSNGVVGIDIPASEVTSEDGLGGYDSTYRVLKRHQNSDDPWIYW